MDNRIPTTFSELVRAYPTAYRPHRPGDGFRDDDPGDEQQDLRRDEDPFYGAGIVIDTELDGGWDQ